MKKELVKNFYNTFDFESMITDPPELIQQFLDGEINFIKNHIKQNKSILEIGCGYGRLLEILGKISNEVTGIDFSEKMITLAKNKLKNKKNIKILQMEANNLEFPGDNFDYVVCLDNSFGNMPNIETQVLKEMNRVCKKGGEVVISVFSDNAKTVQIENYTRIGLKSIRDDGQAIQTAEGFYSRRFSRNELIELFKKNNLDCRIIKICSINFIAYAIK